MLWRLPPINAEVVDLYHLQGMKQREIAARIGVSQAAVSARLDHGVRLLWFIRDLPDTTEGDLCRDLPGLVGEIDTTILVGLWLTLSQSEVARELGTSQGRVRHRLWKAVEVLEAAGAHPYAALFRAIRDIGIKPMWRPGRMGPRNRCTP